MIVVLGSVVVRPEARDRIAAAAAELAAASRREPGCHAYAFSTDLRTPEQFYVHEIWDSLDAMHRHLQEPRVQAFLGLVGEAATAPPVVMRYEVASSAPLF